MLRGLLRKGSCLAHTVCGRLYTNPFRLVSSRRRPGLRGSTFAHSTHQSVLHLQEKGRLHKLCVSATASSGQPSASDKPLQGDTTAPTGQEPVNLDGTAAPSRQRNRPLRGRDAKKLRMQAEMAQETVQAAPVADPTADTAPATTTEQAEVQEDQSKKRKPEKMTIEQLQAEKDRIRQKKLKKMDPRAAATSEIVMRINMAAKRNDFKLMKQLLVESQSHEGGPLHLPLAAYNTMLFVVVGGELWEAVMRGGDPQVYAICNVSGEDPADKAQQLAAAVAETDVEVTAAPNYMDIDSNNGRPSPAPSDEPAASFAPADEQGSERAQQQQEHGDGSRSRRATPPVVPATWQDVLSAGSREERIQVAEQVLAAFSAAGCKRDERTYLAIARLEGLKGNADKSLSWAKDCRDSGCGFSLRLVAPAMVGYAQQHSTAAMEDLDSMLMQTEVDLTEYEFARLLEVYAADRKGAWHLMRGVLARMTKELEQLSPSTLQLLEAYFKSPQARFARTRKVDIPADVLEARSKPTIVTVNVAGDDSDTVAVAVEANSQYVDPAAVAASSTEMEEEVGYEPVPEAQLQGEGLFWDVQTVQVDSLGHSDYAGGTLRVVDLEEAEWTSFAEGVAQLAHRNERSKESFQNFIDWYNRNGPYDILIDGANVAFFGQNRDGGGFNWGQIERMVESVQEKHPGSKILVMMHKRRTQDYEARARWVQDFIARLTKNKSFYATPPGSNDDWYWLYATIRARQGGLLISNDLLRDHIFSLLRPKHFLKWKARHIVNYSYPGPKTYPILTYPPAFTSCVQKLDSGSWMFPGLDGTWLCVKPRE